MEDISTGLDYLSSSRTPTRAFKLYKFRTFLGRQKVVLRFEELRFLWRCRWTSSRASCSAARKAMRCGRGSTSTWARRQLRQKRHAGRGGNRRARGAGLACCRRSVHRGLRWALGLCRPKMPSYIICVVVEAYRFFGSQSESWALKFPALVADHSPVAQQAGAQTHT